MRGNYGPGPTTAGTTTNNAPALPSITMVPNPTARPTEIPRHLKQTDGKQIACYSNPDRIMVGQGTNHKGNQ
jgi:hypothetical protein